MKIFHFIFEQIVPVVIVPIDVENYDSSPEEVKMIRPLYDINTSEFKELEETIGLLNVKGDPDETSFNYSFNEKRSKNLYSVQKRRIPNVFSGKMF